MCIFVGPERVEVASTRIFARLDGTEQSLVYSMQMSSRSDVAMVLPIPVPPAPDADAVSFVSLEDYPQFFDALDTSFRGATAGVGRGAGLDPTLAVHEVGAFDASFVPRPEEFARVDPRFRLPDAVWTRRPVYADYGFVVFMLRKGEHQRVHPMAFRFPVRDPSLLFFPTVHVHDGTLHEAAAFDHLLYYQNPTGIARKPSIVKGLASKTLPSGDLISTKTAADYVDLDKTLGLVRGEQVLCRRRLVGQLPNEDHWLRSSSRNEWT